MKGKNQDRRQFLKKGAALAAVAMGGIPLAKAQSQAEEPYEIPPGWGPVFVHKPWPPLYGVPSRFEKVQRGRNRIGTNTPLGHLYGMITPSGLHTSSQHGSPVPDIDPEKHRLMIHGMVDHPMVLTMAELKRLPSVGEIHFVACAGVAYLDQSNRKKLPQTVGITHGLIGNAEWVGVPLSLLLKEAGVQKNASWLVAEGADLKRHTISIPLTKAMDDVIVAYAQNGEALRPELGYPLRLIVPGWEGVRNCKWLRRIKVVDGPQMTKWDSAIYTNMKPDGKSRWFQFEFEPNSVITQPSGGQRLTDRGFWEIRGIAWAGGGAVRRVEVSTDGGHTWGDAQLQQPVLPKAITRFRFPWTWNGEEAVLMSRCTDEWGDVQPTVAQLCKIWGTPPDFFKTSNLRIEHFNGCQPWKVSRDGSIHNAIW